MDQNELDRRIMESKPEGVRSRGRPKLKWVDEWSSGIGEKPRLELDCSAEDNNGDQRYNTIFQNTTLDFEPLIGN